MRCSAHDLALGPDGRCVLCRRQATERPPVPPARRAVNVLGALVGLLLLGGAGWAAWLRPAEAPPESAPRTLAAAEIIPEDEPSEAPAEPRRQAPDRAEPDDGGAGALTQSNSVADAAAAPARPPPTPAEITAALRSTPVWMFTTAWCGVCDRARAFFRANQIPFQERDIDKSPSDRRELVALTGKTSIPYIDIDGQRLSGFGEQSAAEALRRSVERRLGVKGLQLQSSR